MLKVLALSVIGITIAVGVGYGIIAKFERDDRAHTARIMMRYCDTVCASGDTDERCDCDE